MRLHVVVRRDEDDYYVATVPQLPGCHTGVVIKALGRIGFLPVRQRGSHLIMKHPDGRSTVIPVHPGEELGRGILTEIMSDVMTISSISMPPASEPRIISKGTRVPFMIGFPYPLNLKRIDLRDLHAAFQFPLELCYFRLAA